MWNAPARDWFHVKIWQCGRRHTSADGDRLSDVVDGPMRSTALAVRCKSCEQIATSHCLRCNRPACDEHAPARGRRCAMCEGELERRLDRTKPIELEKGLVTAAKVSLYAGLGSGLAFGATFLILGLIIVLFGGMGIAQALGMAAAAAVIFGLLGSGTAAILSLPFIGAGGAVAGSRALVRKLEAQRFLRERPGQRRLNPATAPIAEEE